MPDQLRDELVAMGSVDDDRRRTPRGTGWRSWAPCSSLVAAVLAVLLAPAVARDGQPATTPRVAAASGVGAGTPEEQTSLDLWKALDEGRDPTAPDPD